jgi:4-hydroxy-2-oxoheptanedioate aldolase
MMIQQGFRVIAVAFDLWGFANLVHGSLKQAKEYAQQAGESNRMANGKVTNGEATNGEDSVS